MLSEYLNDPEKGCSVTLNYVNKIKLNTAFVISTSDVALIIQQQKLVSKS